ncbi:hypothetical protein Taro_022804 [Colocasia esculenta]|uniref:Uncharacterized protein n=1 Tax=Colocasia esculenta TaxID=4460 RepID=A0A843V4P5_COLES|nr:hypothetical protein [Colocasia esculenta]
MRQHRQECIWSFPGVQWDCGHRHLHHRPPPSPPPRAIRYASRKDFRPSAPFFLRRGLLVRSHVSVRIGYKAAHVPVTPSEVLPSALADGFRTSVFEPPLWLTCSEGVTRGCRAGSLAYAAVITAPGRALHHQEARTAWQPNGHLSA